QAHADRYSYLPQIGLCVAATWAMVDLTRPLQWRREIFSVAGPIIIVLLAWRAWIQTSYWHDTERLWNRTFAVTGQDDIAHLSTGEFLPENHRLDEAIAQLKIVLPTHPNDADANFQTASAYRKKGGAALATPHFERTLKMQPANPDAET